jgi:hypothetical protein
MLQLFCKRFERERERDRVRDLYFDSTRHVFFSTKEIVFLIIRKGEHFPAIKHYVFI